jgi:hypothetical protein
MLTWIRSLYPCIAQMSRWHIWWHILAKVQPSPPFSSGANCNNWASHGSSIVAAETGAEPASNHHRAHPPSSAGRVDHRGANRMLAATLERP